MPQIDLALIVWSVLVVVGCLLSYRWGLGATILAIVAALLGVLPSFVLPRAELGLNDALASVLLGAALGVFAALALVIARRRRRVDEVSAPIAVPSRFDSAIGTARAVTTRPVERPNPFDSSMARRSTVKPETSARRPAGGSPWRDRIDTGESSAPPPEHPGPSWR